MEWQFYPSQAEGGRKMSDRPTPETDKAMKYWPSEDSELVYSDFARRLENERDEAREELREWQTLRLWGGTPEHIHDFIKGQQSRIREVQDIEKTCEKLERELEELRK